MATYRTAAFVLRKRDFREYDQIVTLYTKEKGKVDLIVKGARRIKSKMAGHLEPFGIVDVMIAQGKIQDRIAGTKLLESYSNIKSNLDATALSVYFNEVVGAVIHGNQADPKVFYLVQEAYEAIDHYIMKNGVSGNIQDQVLMILSYILRLLDAQGLAPDFNLCFYCKQEVREEKNYISYRHFSVVCPACRQQEEILHPVLPTALKVLRMINQKNFRAVKLKNLEPGVFSEVRNLVNSFILMVSERQINSYSFLTTLIFNSQN